jgi:hypothetical protein
MPMLNPSTPQQKVFEFMKAFQPQDLPNESDGIRPLDWDSRLGQHCKKLVDEEIHELFAAVLLEDQLDAIGDSIYVLYYCLNAMGVYDFAPFFNEIHRSNMTKLWTWVEINSPSYYSRKADFEELEVPVAIGLVNPTKVNDRLFIVRNKLGKLIKSPSYSKPDLKSILALVKGYTHGN